MAMTKTKSKTAIHFLKWSFPLGSLLVSLPLGSVLASPAMADTAVLIDPNSATAAPAMAAVRSKPTVIKASRPDSAAVPTRKPAAVVAAATAETSPFDLNITYTGEAWQNHGGTKTGFDYMYGVDASLTVNLQKLVGLQDAKIYVEGYYVGGKSLESFTGAEQAPSALDAFSSQNVAKLYQLYYEQQFAGTNILIGKFDVQQQFGTTHPMDLFANKAQAMTMTYFTAGLINLNFPSVYPDTSVGVRIKQQINDQWSVKVAVLNGEADSPDATNSSAVVFAPKYGVLGLGEVDYTPSKYTKLMAGVWTDTGQLTEWRYHAAPLTTWGEVGEYVGGATRIYTIEGSRGVDAFFNVGLAPSATNLADRSGDVGITVTGLFAARPNDKLGVAFALDHNSTDFKNFENLVAGKHLADYESVVEGTYRAKITDWLNVQPQVDYIGNPALASPAKSAFAFGLHFELHRDFN